MTSLPHSHLMTLKLEVDFARTTRIGTIPAGHRGIAAVTGGTFAGARLNGTVEPGADWFVIQPDGSLLIDVRLTLISAEAVPIYLSYRGSMRGRGDAMARFAKGELLDPRDYNLIVYPAMESGDHRYSWLNNLPLIGIGKQTVTGPVYEIQAIGQPLDR